MTIIPRTGAGVIAMNDDKFLLIKRGKDPHKGCWSLPGGTQEAGETLEQCARREFKEETNLDVGDLLFVTMRDRIKYNADGSISHHYVLATYISEDISGEPKAMDDAEDIGWFGLDEMDKLQTTPGTPEFISNLMNDLF